MADGLLKERVREQARREIERRKQMLQQKDRCEQDLLAFVETFWPVLEPQRPLIGGWLLDFLCDVLMAVTDGQLVHVCINVPPGSGKSSLLNVLWPAWEWGPQNMAHLRYLSISYSTGVPVRDNQRFARIVQHPVYQRLWGERVRIQKARDDLVENAATGWKLVASVGGTTTGFRGDRILCFPAHEVVLTNRGSLPIGYLVRNRIKASVWSTDVVTGASDWKPITAWHANGPAELVELFLSDGGHLTCTASHRIWTRNRGWVAASMLSERDVLPGALGTDGINCPFGYAVSGGKDFEVVSGHKDFPHIFFREFCNWVVLAFSLVRLEAMATGELHPGDAAADLLNGLHRNAVSCRKNPCPLRAFGNRHGLFGGEDGARASLAEWECSVLLGVIDVLRTCPVMQIGEVWIAAISVFVTNFHTLWLGADEGQCYHHMDLPKLRNAVTAKIAAGIAVAERRFKQALFKNVGASLAGDRSGMAFDAPTVGHAIKGLPAGDRTPVLVRRIGHTAETFCLTVADYHTFYCGSHRVLVGNCDDLNNPKNVESETVREDTNQFVREVMPSRVNDLAKSAIINLQQRTHRSDVTATLIEHGQDYQFVCVPMEFDPLRICSVVLRRNEDGEAEQTWTDPRALDEHGGLLSGLTVNERGEPDVRFGSPMAQAQGQICWPELFTPEAIAKLKAMSGPYGWDSQFNQFPGVRGGSIIRRDWWKLWNGPYPELGTVIVSLDTATEEGSQNDYNACTVFAAFAGLEGEPQLLLLDAWRERLPLAQLVAKVARTCQERAADYLLIEHKTRGRDVHDEIVRIYVSAKWQTELVKPGTIDKINRLKAVEHLFSGDYRMDPATKIESWSGGIVFAPDRDFADMVITEVADFPYAPHDDLVDCVSMCLGWVRRNGVILRKVEWAEEELARNTFRKSPGVPYAIKSSQ